MEKTVSSSDIREAEAFHCSWIQSYLMTREACVCLRASSEGEVPGKRMQWVIRTWSEVKWNATSNPVQSSGLKTTVSHENSTIINLMNARKEFWADMFEHKCLRWNKPFFEMQSLLINGKIENFMEFRKDTWQPECYTMIDVITLNTTVVSNDLGPSQEVHASALCLMSQHCCLVGIFSLVAIPLQSTQSAGKNSICS